MAKKSNGGSYSRRGSSSKGISSARLNQKSGSSNSFGGYTKVNQGNGNFTMRKSGSGK